MTETIEYEIDGHIAYLRFNRPEKGNALSWEMWKAVADAIYNADEDETVRALIVTGNGEAFCAGGDLNDLLPKMMSGEVEIWPKATREDMMLRNKSVQTPIIAAVNGACLAGGVEFLQATDIRVAAEDAIFGLPETTHGLVPAGGTHTRLPRQIPYAHAMELILTGDPVSAHDAHRMGLVNTVVDGDKVLEEAERYAASIVENGPAAVQTAKEIVTRGLGMSMEDSFALEDELGKDVIRGEGAKEGVKTFQEGRDGNAADES